MATVAVVLILLVSGVAFGGDHEYSRESASKGLLHLNFLYPDRRARHERGFVKVERDNEDRTGSKVRHTILPVFIPVRYDLRGQDAVERRVTEDDPINPRLVMDHDFNIKFDNPNIVPLTKPLAFILSNSANARESRTEENEKIMVPFPVLVKAREGIKDCRDDDVLEHRSNYNDENDYHSDFVHENPPMYRNKVTPIYRHEINGTTTFHKTNNLPGRDFIYSIRGKNYPESAYYYTGIPPGRTQDYSNNSSREYQSLDVYPGKIFADMYRTLPKQALESVESQEIEDYRYDKRRHIEDVNMKTNYRHPYRGHTFSASNDLHWVTEGNSTKTMKSNEYVNGFVIYDVTESPVPTTTLATSTTTSVTNDGDWGRKLPMTVTK